MPSLKRALVECAVLALQDSSVFYPYCKGCFSRIDTNPEDSRLTCSKCGYSCAKSLLVYRYRLSMRVARGSCMFGVTVFGNCLNPFFGISASGFQRLVVDKSGPLELSKSTLLVKAVEECFIGKHFIFGIKVTENDIKPWVESTQVNSHMAQLIATQMILPKAAGLRGCTVLHYFKAAVQRAAEPKQCTICPKETAKLNGEPLWPIPHNSPTPVFSNDTLHSSGFLPLSLSRSQRLDRSLSPTPPWQQTLGLITSSAEQEESCKDDKKSLCFSDKCRRSATPLDTWAGLTPPTHKTAGLPTLQVNDISTSAITKSILTTCPAQDQFPLSESLTEFLKDGHKLDHSQQSLFLESACDDTDFMSKSQVCDCYNENKTAAIKASEEEQSEGSIFNCSADLFSNSPSMDMNSVAFAPVPACAGHASAGLLHTRSLGDSFSLTAKQPLFENDQKQAKCNIRESFRLSAKFDFIPPSQSTPAERIAVQKGKSLRSDLRIKHIGKSTKENVNNTNQATLHCCATPKSRYTKIQSGLLTKKRFSARRGVLNSAVNKRKSSGFGDKDNAKIIPPTPTRLPNAVLFNHYKEQTFNGTESDSKPSECGLVVDESECNNADEVCDWSRDLFSDSV